MKFTVCSSPHKDRDLLPHLRAAHRIKTPNQVILTGCVYLDRLDTYTAFTMFTPVYWAEALAECQGKDM